MFTGNLDFLEANRECYTCDISRLAETEDRACFSGVGVMMRALNFQQSGLGLNPGLALYGVWIQCTGSLSYSEGSFTHTLVLLPYHNTTLILISFGLTLTWSVLNNSVIYLVVIVVIVIIIITFLCGFTCTFILTPNDKL